MATEHRIKLPPMVPPSWSPNRYRRRTSYAALAVQGLKMILDAIVALQDRSRRRHALATLDDRLLEDVGLTRADADRAAGFLR